MKPGADVDADMDDYRRAADAKRRVGRTRLRTAVVYWAVLVGTPAVAIFVAVRNALG